MDTFETWGGSMSTCRFMGRGGSGLGFQACVELRVLGCRIYGVGLGFHPCPGLVFGA